MTDMKYIVLLLSVLSSLALADETPKISVLSVDVPIWASGLNNAEWLLPERKEGATKIGFFNLSAKKANMPKEPITQKEDDIGRTSRSLPLYLAERINVETGCSATNYIFVVQGVGPVLSGKESDFASLKDIAIENNLAIIVFGHYEKDYLDLRSTLKIEAWDVKDEKKMFSLLEQSLFSEPSGVAAKIPHAFRKKLQHKNICKYTNSAAYPRPGLNILPPYLDGLGQLLTQTLADNEVFQGSAIWGEVNMIEWYRSLWQHMPESDANRLMFAKGLIASKRYGGVAHKEYSNNFREFLKSNFSVSDTLSRLSPLFYSEFGFKDECTRAKKKLSEVKGKYNEWLLNINCEISNNLIQPTAKAAPD
jgi:hypothetical protein